MAKLFLTKIKSGEINPATRRRLGNFKMSDVVESRGRGAIEC